jgi:4-hydroxy-3-polyprenylbenzoate decarboxylase
MATMANAPKATKAAKAAKAANAGSAQAGTRDLRDWIDRIDRLGELTRVDGADPNEDVGGLTDLYQWDMSNPALLFDHLQGFEPGHRILSNVLTSLPRLALTLNLETAQTKRAFVDALRRQLAELRPIPALEADDGPVLANQMAGDSVDLNRFPAPLWHPNDGGPFLGTGCVVVMRDPDAGWVNAGTYRVQLQDERTVTVYISPGKQGQLIQEKWWKRGEACPTAVCVGMDPLILLQGGYEVESGVSEFDVAGGILGAPVPLVRGAHTGLPFPAHAELVLEGEMPPGEVLPEGPFGEWAGYYASGQRPCPVLRVKRVYFRDDPIVVGCLPGKPPNDNTYFRSPMRGAVLWNDLERSGIQGIVGAYSHEAGGGRLFNVIAIRQLYAGHAKQVGAAAASARAGAYANRFVVVVDDDIDPTDTNEVLWALCTRTDVVRDIDVLRRCWSSGLDPMAYQGDGPGWFNDRLIIDACRPYDRKQTFPAVARVTPEEAMTMRARWPGLFGADGKAAREPKTAERPATTPAT